MNLEYNLYKECFKELQRVSVYNNNHLYEKDNRVILVNRDINPKVDISLPSVSLSQLGINLNQSIVFIEISMFYNVSPEILYSCFDLQFNIKTIKDKGVKVLEIVLRCKESGIILGLHPSLFLGDNEFCRKDLEKKGYSNISFRSVLEKELSGVVFNFLCVYMQKFIGRNVILMQGERYACVRGLNFNMNIEGSELDSRLYSCLYSVIEEFASTGKELVFVTGIFEEKEGIYSDRINFVEYVYGGKSCIGITVIKN